MSLGHGSSVVRNGLVFHYDMSNTQKSWKGAPTTNRCANGEGVYTSGSVPGFWGREQAFGGIEPSGQTSGIDAYGYGYFQFTISGTTTLVNRLLISPVMYYNSEAAVTAGTTYTFSYNIDNVSNYGYGIQATYLWYDSSNTFLSVTNGTYHPTISGWSRKTDTVTAPVNAAKVTTRFDFNGYSTIGTVLNFTLRLGGIQWEASAFQTPYVKTTNGIASRSNTQAILDLTGNNTVTSTSLTYASDNTFKFVGGSSNVINMGNTVNAQFPHNSAWSLQLIFKIDAMVNTYPGILLKGNSVSSGVLLYYQANGTMYWKHNNAQVGLTSLFTIAGPVVVLTITYTGSAMYFYKNSNLIQTGGAMASTESTTDLLLGRGDEYGSSTIYSFQKYNRSLSATEVQQNFEALRGRYGI